MKSQLTAAACTRKIFALEGKKHSLEIVHTIRSLLLFILTMKQVAMATKPIVCFHVDMQAAVAMMI
jgi:hypothetical protein